MTRFENRVIAATITQRGTGVGWALLRVKNKLLPGAVLVSGK